MHMLNLFAIGGLMIGAGALLDCQHEGRCRKAHVEEQLDDALDGTFPASDPTATQDFAIPANRA